MNQQSDQAEWRVVHKRDPDSGCQAASPMCNKPVSAVLIWKTDQMDAPAYWYVCSEHAFEASARSTGTFGRPL